MMKWKMEIKDGNKVDEEDEIKDEVEDGVKMEYKDGSKRNQSTKYNKYIINI